jgi:CubicO group peptidase (beta-lactamase class C family)
MRLSKLPILVTWLACALPAAGAEDPPSIADIIQPFVDQGRFAGAVVAIVSKDKVLDFQAVGYADVAAKKPMRKDTMFWIASTSKPFQATALMMLVDDGKVKLDDPVSKYLPGFSPRISEKAADGTETLREPTQPVTLRMLLNHTHGLRNPIYSPIAPKTDSVPLSAFVDDLLTRPLLNEPGTTFSYSDNGVSVASRVVEVVSGLSFEAFLESRLLKPLGMKDTTYFPSKEQQSRLATAYFVPPGTKTLMPVPPEMSPLTSPLDDRKLRYAPVGALFSTASDLGKFAQMFLNKGKLHGHRYLSENAVAEMTRSQLSAQAKDSLPQLGGLDAPHSYGLGWGLGSTGAYFHPGMASTDIRVDPTRRIGIVYLPQHGGDDVAFEIRWKIMDSAERRFVPNGK